MKCPYCTADVSKVKSPNCEDKNTLAVMDCEDVFDVNISVYQCLANPKHIFYCDDFKGNSVINCEDVAFVNEDETETWKNEMYDEMKQIGVESFVANHPEIWYIRYNCKCGTSIGSFSIDAGKKGICERCNTIFQFPVDSIATRSLAVDDKKCSYKINDHR